MQVFHRAVPFTGEDIRQHAEGKIDAGVDLFLFGAWRATQDKIRHHAGDARVANADPQTVKGILIAKLRDDVPQPVVTAVPAALLELGDAGWQIEFVVGHQYFLRLDTEKAGKRRDGLAAAVHVSGGNQQTNVLTLVTEAPGQAEIFAIGDKVDPLCVRDALNKKGPRVMPSLFVFGAWISQANDQFDGSHVRGPSFGVVDNIAASRGSAAKTNEIG